MTQLRAQLASSKGPHRVLVISIDASLDRLDTNGSRFQQRGDEERYAWTSTFFGHGVETIDSAVALMQDLGWKFLEGTGVETDQINMNWETSLTQRRGLCGPAAKSSWENMFEDGRLTLRPLIIRLGLRDIINPDFEGQYGASLAPATQKTRGARAPRPGMTLLSDTAISSIRSAHACIIARRSARYSAWL